MDHVLKLSLETAHEHDCPCKSVAKYKEQPENPKSFECSSHKVDHALHFQNFPTVCATDEICWILMIGQIGHGWVPKCRSLLFALLTTMRIFNPAIFCLLHCSRGFSIFSLFPVCSAFFLISVNHFLCGLVKDVYDMNSTQEDTSLLWISDSSSKSTEGNIRSPSITTIYNNLNSIKVTITTTKKAGFPQHWFPWTPLLMTTLLFLPHFSILVVDFQSLSKFRSKLSFASGKWIYLSGKEHR